MVAAARLIPRARASRTQEKGAGRQGCPLCSRTAHSGLIRSGPRRMECRVPVAFQIATGDDARSLRLPGHQSEEQRKDHAVPGTPPLRRSRSRSYRTWLGRSKGHAEGFLGWRNTGWAEEKMSMEVES